MWIGRHVFQIGNHYLGRICKEYGLFSWGFLGKCKFIAVFQCPMALWIRLQLLRILGVIWGKQVPSREAFGVIFCRRISWIRQVRRTDICSQEHRMCINCPKFPLLGWFIEGFLDPFNNRYVMDGMPVTGPSTYCSQKDIVAHVCKRDTIDRWSTGLGWVKGYGYWRNSVTQLLA